MDNQKSVQLTSKNTVSIIAAAPNVDLNSEIYAVNWFDLKRPWLYEFYSQMAYPHVEEVDGRIHFKGLVTEKIKGPKENDRQLLLIVKYPSADHFLKMISNKMFLYKSMLRIKAVDYFTFGFTKRMDTGPPSLKIPKAYDGDLYYFSHHFQTKDSPAKSLYDLQDIIAGWDVETHFMGFKAALVGRSSPQSKLRTQPFLIDGISVFASKNQEKIHDLMKSQDFQSWCMGHLTDNYYRLNRTI